MKNLFKIVIATLLLVFLTSTAFSQKPSREQKQKHKTMMMKYKHHRPHHRHQRLRHHRPMSKRFVGEVFFYQNYVTTGNMFDRNVMSENENLYIAKTKLLQ